MTEVYRHDWPNNYFSNINSLSFPVSIFKIEMFLIKQNYFWLNFKYQVNNWQFWLIQEVRLTRAWLEDWSITATEREGLGSRSSSVISMFS